MARKRHSPESIAAVLRRVESGITLEEAARKAGVHVNTILLWKKKYGQMGTVEIREMNELRDENTRLKRLVADLSLDKGDAPGRALKKILKPAVQRRIAGDMRERYHVSERRISTTFAFNRSSLQYAARRSEFRDDARRITSLQLADGAQRPRECARAASSSGIYSSTTAASLLRQQRLQAWCKSIRRLTARLFERFFELNHRRE